jgi:hypothetical protein
VIAVIVKATKRVLFFALALVALCALTAGAAHAATVKFGDITVADPSVTEGDPSSSPYWKWDSGSNTLTLGAGYTYDGTDPIEIKDLGAGATIINNAATPLVFNVTGVQGLTSDENLTIEGAGTLSITTHPNAPDVPEDIAAINVSDGDLTISSGTIVANTTGENVDLIHAEGDMTINGTAHVTAISPKGIGIHAYGGVNITGNAVVIAEGEDCGIESVDDDLKIGGNVIVNAKGIEAGIRDFSGVIIEGNAEVTAEGNDGILAYNNIDLSGVTGGAVTAIGGSNDGFALSSGTAIDADYGWVTLISPNGKYASVNGEDISSTLQNAIMRDTIPTAPGAPRNFLATPGNGQVELTWSAPESNGGSEITGYRVSEDGGTTYIAASSNTSHTFTGLTNGQSYSFRVLAVNGVGEGPAETATATPQASTSGGGGDAGGGDGNAGGGDTDDDDTGGGGSGDGSGSGDGNTGGGNTILPETDGSVNVTIPVTDSNGQQVAVTSLADTSVNDEAQVKLAEMGLSAEIIGGEVVVAGEAVDIGAVTLEVVLESGETTTVTFAVNPLPPVPATSVNVAPASWTGALSESVGADGAPAYAFRVDIPLDLKDEEITLISNLNVSTSADVTFSGNVDNYSAAIVLTSGEGSGPVSRGAGEGVFIETGGTTADPDSVTVERVSYRIGIHQYEQETNVKLTDANLIVESDDDDYDYDYDSSGSGSGDSDSGDVGCNSGAFGFVGLTLICAVARRRKRAR